MSMELQAEPDIDQDIEADARRAIVRTLNRHPYDVWTRDNLARSLGVPTGLAGRILTQLASAGMVRRLPADGPDEEYTVAGEDY
jgi:DprA winged helix domain